MSTTPANTPVQHVYTAIAAITAAIGKDGVGKASRNTAQNYNFRGIDDVLNALSPLLSTNNLCMLPCVLERECVERQTKNGGAIFYVTVKVRYDLISAVDGSRHSLEMYGEAMDAADKATNKAMSAAYKYAAVQAFCIPVVGYDTEGEGDQGDPLPRITEAQLAGWRVRIGNSKTADQIGPLWSEILAACKNAQDSDTAALLKADCEARATTLRAAEKATKPAPEGAKQKETA